MSLGSAMPEPSHPVSPQEGPSTGVPAPNSRYDRRTQARNPQNSGHQGLNVPTGMHALSYSNLRSGMSVPKLGSAALRQGRFALLQSGGWSGTTESDLARRARRGKSVWHRCNVQFPRWRVGLVSLGFPLVEWNFTRADLRCGNGGVLVNPGGTISAS